MVLWLSDHGARGPGPARCRAPLPSWVLAHSVRVVRCGAPPADDLSTSMSRYQQLQIYAQNPSKLSPEQVKQLVGALTRATALLARLTQCPVCTCTWRTLGIKRRWRV